MHTVYFREYNNYGLPTYIGIIVTKVEIIQVPQMCSNSVLQFNNYADVWIVCTGTNVYGVHKCT